MEDIVFETDLISHYAELYGVNERLARNIIQCESQGNPKALNYNYRNGEVWSTDKGYWQINNYYHQERMTELGLDINNPVDNLKFGFMLLSEQGTEPWNASAKCWKTL